ncbi:MAG: IS1 family transposase [Phycisphaerae bacterium]
MNKLTTSDRVRIVAALVEGNSIRSTVRMTGIAKNTILGLLVDLGSVCSVFQSKTMRGLKCKRLQLDEIWSFCGAKEKNVPDERRGQHGAGDVWTWTAIDADTKLIPAWYVGKRCAEDAEAFIADLSERLAEKPQITTDGLKMYVTPIQDSFGEAVDYAMLVKVYGMDPAAGHSRYSQVEVIGIEKKTIMGNPDWKHISTSFVERANLTMRMGMRRFTRLTNAFSKKIENHEAAIALHFMHYNFCRIHQTLRVTPAMAAGLTDHVREIEEVIGLLEAEERQAVAEGALKRGKYRNKENYSN